MNKTQLIKLLACPKCKTPLYKYITKKRCPKCYLHFGETGGIWDFLTITNERTKKSHDAYNLMHKKKFGGPIDGSYEILASIAKGNRTVDIACGEGIIESIASETVGVEFSLNALKKAKKVGAKYLVHADAHALPFIDNAFKVAISTGNLEHFADPQLAIHEMVRISKIQVLTVHQHPPLPFAHQLHIVATKLFNINHQPIEKPISQKRVVKMLEKAGAHVVFKGVWTLPFNYGRVIKVLPEIKAFPAVSFAISIKK